METETEKKPNRGRGRLDGVGRAKGTPNKNTKAVKDMIVQALHEAGGVAYLVEQAKKNPKAFLPLLARVLPLQLTGDGGGPIQTENVNLTAEEAYKRMIDGRA
jgi:hypothetical protein